MITAPARADSHEHVVLPPRWRLRDASLVLGDGSKYESDF